MLAAILGGSPAFGQLYKWVDRRGVTNYSSQPPSDPAEMSALRPIENQVSVYTPDPALMRAVESFRRGDDEGAAAGASRTGVGSGQPQRAAVARPDPCLNSGAADCAGTYAGDLPYDPWYGYARPPLRWPRHIAQPLLIPGTAAGNVVGMNGYIPGYSAYAPPARALSAPRVLYEVSTTRGPSRR